MGTVTHNDDGTITWVLTNEEYESITYDIEWLGYLEAAGVDNWQGYDYARELQQEAEDE
jgi:hypothetical protein